MTCSWSLKSQGWILVGAFQPCEHVVLAWIAFLHCQYLLDRLMFAYSLGQEWNSPCILAKLFCSCEHCNVGVIDSNNAIMFASETDEDGNYHVFTFQLRLRTPHHGRPSKTSHCCPPPTPPLSIIAMCEY